MPSKGDVHVPFGSRVGTIQSLVLEAADIAAGAISTAKLAADAVTGAKIADDAIDSEHIADGAIDTAHIGDDQVTEAKIADAALTGAVVATVADSNVIGGLPVLFRIPIAGGAAGDTDVVVTNKVRVIDVWAVHTVGKSSLARRSSAVILRPGARISGQRLGVPGSYLELVGLEAQPDDVAGGVDDPGRGGPVGVDPDLDVVAGIPCLRLTCVITAN